MLTKAEVKEFLLYVSRNVEMYLIAWEAHYLRRNFCNLRSLNNEMHYSQFQRPFPSNISH